MNLAKMIDHTLLRADAEKEEVEKLCSEALEYGFKSVCVNPYYVSLCKEKLKDSPVEIATVIGFPLGNNKKEVKAFETSSAIEDGASEVDMVINLPALKNGDYSIVRDDIRAVVEAAKGRALVKVIIESCYLTDEEKVKACQLAMEAGADYVKTSTGFGTGGASVHDIELMKSVVKDELGIKASGGIRDYETSMAMINAGATRLGASAGVKIIESL